MNASFTCKISTIKVVRFIFLLKRVMPWHFWFCYLIRPCSWDPVFSLGAEAEPQGRWVLVTEATPALGVPPQLWSSPSFGGEWWWGSAGELPGRCGCCASHVCEPVPLLSPISVCGNGWALPFWSASQMKNLRKGKAQLFPWILRVLLEGLALEGRCFFQSFHCGNESSERVEYSVSKHISFHRCEYWSIPVFY